MDKITYIKGICIKDYRKFEKGKIYDIVNVENNISISSYLVRFNNSSMDLVPKSYIILLTEWRKIRIEYIFNEIHMYKQ